MDGAYGGYCCFAQVAADDAPSWRTIDSIAAAIKGGEKAVAITTAREVA